MMTAVTRLAKAAVPVLALLVLATGAGRGADNRAPDLGDYTELAAPEGHQVAARAYAEGVQIYRWDGAGWAFVGPEAVLYDQDGEEVGIHYGGPTWESASGSKVVAAVDKRATPDPKAIPWLRLKAVSSEGPGILNGVTYVQRVNTTGGLAPVGPGTFVGEVARVPYTADYYFYKERP